MVIIGNFRLYPNAAAPGEWVVDDVRFTEEDGPEGYFATFEAAHEYFKGRTRGAAAGPEQKFLAQWNTSYGAPNEKLVDGGFFSEDQGYDDEDRAEIEALPVGGTWRSGVSSHTVTRVA